MIWKRTSQFYSSLPFSNVRKCLVLQANRCQIYFLQWLNWDFSKHSNTFQAHYAFAMSFYGWWYFTSKPSIEIPGFHTFDHKQVSASPLEKKEKKKGTFLLCPVFCKQSLITNIKLNIFPRRKKNVSSQETLSLFPQKCLYLLNEHLHRTIES